MSHRSAFSLLKRPSFGPPAILLLLLLSGIAGAELERSTGMLAAGTQWENPCYVTRSSTPGPTVLVTAGLHGNEPAGYRAAAQILHWPIRRGTLIVVPRANTPGLQQKTRWLPGEPEDTRNANRNFPKDGAANHARSLPMKALWEIVQEQQPDWVVDLHEGFDFHVANPASDGSSIIYFDSPEMQALATKIQESVNATIVDSQRKIVRLSGKGPVNGGLVRAAVQRLNARGFCFETTYQKQPLSTRTRQHRIMVHRLLQELEMTAASSDVMTSSERGETIAVGLYDAAGTSGKGVANLTRILGPAPDPQSARRFSLHHLGPAEIRPEVLSQFDVVVFPGGSGSKEAAALGPAGRTAMRQFVRSGGGYVGICAGAYLATAKYDWGLALLNAKTFTGKRNIPGVGEKSMWFRGSGSVQVTLTETGRQVLGDWPNPLEVRYANGPILSPAGVAELPAYETLATFATEISKYEPQHGTMVDTPAIVTASFGAGRAMAISPHPEAVEGLEPLVRRAVRWAAGRDGVSGEPQAQ
jgi:hypothetical protein